MTQEWLADLASETSQVVFDASVDLYEQGTSAVDPEAAIALALSQAYERGQVDMRERAADRCAALKPQSCSCAKTHGDGDHEPGCMTDRIVATVSEIRALPVGAIAGKDTRSKAEQIMRDALGRIALLDQYEVVDDTSPYDRTAKCMGQLAIIALDALNKADAGKDA